MAAIAGAMHRSEMLTFALIVGLACLPLAAQDGSAPKRFAGTWEAKYKDTVICTIKLQASEQISGSTEACGISVDENGELREPEATEHSNEPSPIPNPSIRGDTLSFEGRGRRPAG